MYGVDNEVFVARTVTFIVKGDGKKVEINHG